MKSDTERKRYYTEKLHRKKSRLHVHLSRDLRGKLKVRKRAILVREGDTVRVMRGPHRDKEARVSRVSTVDRKVFLEGISTKTARGKEKPIPLEPSNLMLLTLEATKERKEIFSEDAFKKKEIKKAAEAKAAEAKTAEKAEAPKAGEKAPEHKAGHEAGHSHEHKGESHEHGHKHDVKPHEQKSNAIR